jgi:DnaJ-class molecular chaperone
MGSRRLCPDCDGAGVWETQRGCIVIREVCDECDGCGLICETCRQAWTFCDCEEDTNANPTPNQQEICRELIARRNGEYATTSNETPMFQPERPANDT